MLAVFCIEPNFSSRGRTASLLPFCMKYSRYVAFTILTFDKYGVLLILDIRNYALLPSPYKALFLSLLPFPIRRYGSHCNHTPDLTCRRTSTKYVDLTFLTPKWHELSRTPRPANLSRSPLSLLSALRRVKNRYIVSANSFQLWQR